MADGSGLTDGRGWRRQDGFYFPVIVRKNDDDQTYTHATMPSARKFFSRLSIFSCASRTADTFIWSWGTYTDDIVRCLFIERNSPLVEKKWLRSLRFIYVGNGVRRDGRPPDHNDSLVGQCGGGRAPGWIGSALFRHCYLYIYRVIVVWTTSPQIAEKRNNEENN